MSFPSMFLIAFGFLISKLCRGNGFLPVYHKLRDHRLHMHEALLTSVERFPRISKAGKPQIEIIQTYDS